jgi:hypothetical protein
LRLRQPAIVAPAEGGAARSDRWTVLTERLLNRHKRENLKMRRQKLTTILGAVVAFACMANAGFAQTPAATTTGTQASRDQDQSAAAMAQQASNPLASSWTLQLQQNNNWTQMPGGDDHTRVQSNLLFQPLISLRLTEKQGLIIRPQERRRRP